MKSQIKLFISIIWIIVFLGTIDYSFSLMSSPNSIALIAGIFILFFYGVFTYWLFKKYLLK